jgi:hypothetical protein
MYRGKPLQKNTQSPYLPSIPFCRMDGISEIDDVIGNIYSVTDIIYHFYLIVWVE